MTEKQFSLCNDGNGNRIFNNNFDCPPLLKGFISAEEVVDTLNGLFDENKQLHSKLAEKDIQLDYLKDENKHIQTVLNINKEYRKENLMVKEECIRLRKEIKELKSFKKQVFDLIEDKIQISKIRVEELRKDAYEKGYPYDPYLYWGVELGLKDLKKELSE